MQVLQKGFIGPLHQAKVILVVLQVIGFHIGNHGNVRAVAQERVIAFAGLGHKIPAAAKAGVALERGDYAPDQGGGVKTSSFKKQGDHRRGGRLAMGSGYGDAVMAVNQGSQQLGAVPDRDAPPAGLLQLAVVRGIAVEWITSSLEPI